MILDFPNVNAEAPVTWDEKAIMGCVCDGGYMGPDCSLRVCPFGDDPVTTCNRDDNVEQVQQVRVFVAMKMDTESTEPDPADAGVQDLAAIIGDEFSLSFRDSFGNNFTSTRIEGVWGDHDDETSTAMVFADLVTNFDLNGADENAIQRIRGALESLPNFAISEVGVSHASATAGDEEMENVYRVTFRHLEEGQHNYGEQNLLHCRMPNVCAGPGCQPRVRQSYLLSIFETDAAPGAPGDLTLVEPSGLLDALAFNYAEGTPDADTWVRFHRDSVLSCPVGETCTASNRVKTLGSVWVVYRSEVTNAVDGQVFIKAMGSDNSDHPELIDVDSVTETPDADGPTLEANGYTYAGRVTSANQHRFDISEFVANTFLDIGGVETEESAGAVLFFEPAQCDVRDVTEDDTRDNEVGFSNFDAENIECSGRGECNRGAYIPCNRSCVVSAWIPV